MVRGAGWRREVGTLEQAERFQRVYRPARSEIAVFEIAGIRFHVSVGAVEKAEAWTNLVSLGGKAEAMGDLVGYRRGPVIHIIDFVPQPGVCGDVTIKRTSVATLQSINTGDPYQPALVAQMRTFLFGGRPTTVGHSHPFEVGLHAHPQTGTSFMDRPSIQDLRFPQPGTVHFMFAPQGRRLIAHGHIDKSIPEDYVSRPFEEMEREGFFRTVVAL